MQHVITHLEIYLDTLTTNEPINRLEGNIEQADLEAQNAAEVRRALRILKAIDDSNRNTATASSGPTVFANVG